jgi:hypothetical protein
MLETLAIAAATALVGAMATDVWQTARSGFARLFGRGDQRRQEVADKRLDEAATKVAEATDQERVRQELLAAWQVRLQDLLEEHPEAEDELRTLTEQVKTQLPAAQQAWVQHNIARDQGTVQAVQGGNQYIYGTPGPAASSPAVESEQPLGGGGRTA